MPPRDTNPIITIEVVLSNFGVIRISLISLFIHNIILCLFREMGLQKSAGQYDSLFVSDRYSDYEGSDDEFEFPKDFDEVNTRRALLESQNCAKIVLR